NPGNIYRELRIAQAAEASKALRTAQDREEHSKGQRKGSGSEDQGRPARDSFRRNQRYQCSQHRQKERPGKRVRENGYHSFTPPCAKAISTKTIIARAAIPPKNPYIYDCTLPVSVWRRPFPMSVTAVATPFTMPSTIEASKAEARSEEH